VPPCSSPPATSSPGEFLAAPRRGAPTGLSSSIPSPCLMAGPLSTDVALIGYPAARAGAGADSATHVSEGFWRLVLALRPDGIGAARHGLPPDLLLVPDSRVQSLWFLLAAREPRTVDPTAIHGFSAALPANPGYARLHEVLAPRDLATARSMPAGRRETASRAEGLAACIMRSRRPVRPTPTAVLRGRRPTCRERDLRAIFARILRRRPPCRVHRTSTPPRPYALAELIADGVPGQRAMSAPPPCTQHMASFRTRGPATSSSARVTGAIAGRSCPRPCPTPSITANLPPSSWHPPPGARGLCSYLPLLLVRSTATRATSSSGGAAGSARLLASIPKMIWRELIWLRSCQIVDGRSEGWVRRA